MNHSVIVDTQNVTSPKVLQCPADSKRTNIGQGYKTFADNLEKFSQLGALPMSIPHLNQLDDGSGIENTLSTRKAKWHKDCVLLFSKTRLDRAFQRSNKRKSDEHSEESHKRLTRQSMNTSKAKKDFMFFL